MDRQIKDCRDTKMSTADSTVEEAARLTRRLVEFERGRCGGRTDQALHRLSAVWGIDSGSVRQLWKRAQHLTFVKAHILDRLRQANEVIATAAQREREILADTARILEERGSSAAWLARQAADLAGEKEGLSQ